MKTKSISFLIIFAIASLLLTSCGTGIKRDTGDDEVQITEQPKPLPEDAPKPFQIAAPVMRIGLVNATATTLVVKSESGMVLRDENDAIVGGSYYHLNFYMTGATGAAPKTIYRIQIASFASSEYAKAFADKLKLDFGLPVATVYASDKLLYRVQVGAESSRAAATTLNEKLVAAGHEGGFIIETVEGLTGKPEMVAVDASGKKIAKSAHFTCWSQNPSTHLAVAGMKYRGAIEVRHSRKGEVLAVNVVNLEDYLRGVVPAEMSGNIYPQIEALKAQALAARTYAYRNRGQYAAQGFDVCNTPTCQVYKGTSVEQPLTDKAIYETRGQIITYHGEPINSLFTSTCGGHTEDVGNIFSGDNVPYLMGVECVPEADGIIELTRRASQNNSQKSDYQFALLKVMGTWPTAIPYNAATKADPELVNFVVRQALRYIGTVATEENFSKENPTMLETINFFVTTAGWQARIEQEISDLDIKMLLPRQIISIAGPDGSRNLLYFLRLGYILPQTSGSLPFNVITTHSSLSEMLLRIIKRESPHLFTAGKMTKISSDMLFLESRSGDLEFELDDNVQLFRRMNGKVFPSDSVQMLAGDLLELIIIRSKVAALVHTPPLQGVTNDRTSSVFQWEVKHTPAQLKQALSRYMDIGEIKDLIPLRRGVSGRTVELKVVGETGEKILKGLQVRWGLGTRESLFVIEKRVDLTGKVIQWRIIGRGWGHGVGLCQVGSYGMAQAGKTYDEILSHYYLGTGISNWQ
jgi:stage II sporulation protein D